MPAPMRRFLPAQHRALLATQMEAEIVELTMAATSP
jgi:hypothetical protein